MCAMATTKKSATKATNPRAKGREAVLVRFEPSQVKALRAEAFRRAAARGSGKPDASEVVREAVAEWMKRNT